MVGNIYKGKVQRVMPGMQAAFVEVGLERAAFLHANDVVRPAPAPASVVDTEETPIPPPPAASVPIVELLRDGQDIVVQVVKDPIGTKGARLTTQISIPSRYLVLLPQSKVVGVSARIEDEAERLRLKTIVSEVSAQHGGFGYIIRTNAEGQPAEALAEDIAYLSRVWNVVERRGREASACSIIYEDLSLPLRAVRDLIRKDVEKVKVDSNETFVQLQAFVAKYMPVLAERLELYTGDRPIFDLYGVEDEIGRALDKQVPLKSGGYLVIDQTEAMTTIDVNTGSFVGQRNLEETVFRTNLEAAQAVARQLRLRNLGGIIIIDFIDMDDPEHRRQVLRTLEKALARDHAKTTVYEFAAGPGGDDPQAHRGKPGAAVIGNLRPVRRARHHQDRRNGHLRNLPRDHPRGAPVRCGAAAGDRLVQGGGAHHRRRIRGGGRAGGIPRQEHPLPVRRPVPAGAV